MFSQRQGSKKVNVFYTGCPRKMSVFQKLIQLINGHFSRDSWYIYKNINKALSLKKNNTSHFEKYCPNQGLHFDSQISYIFLGWNFHVLLFHCCQTYHPTIEKPQEVIGSEILEGFFGMNGLAINKIRMLDHSLMVNNSMYGPISISPIRSQDVMLEIVNLVDFSHNSIHKIIFQIDNKTLSSPPLPSKKKLSYTLHVVMRERNTVSSRYLINHHPCHISLWLSLVIVL